jgi:hypothetical protein
MGLCTVSVMTGLKGEAALTYIPRGLRIMAESCGLTSEKAI